jgi:hypothetical protein
MSIRQWPLGRAHRWVLGAGCFCWAGTGILACSGCVSMDKWGGGAGAGAGAGAGGDEGGGVSGCLELV